MFNIWVFRPSKSAVIIYLKFLEALQYDNSSIHFFFSSLCRKESDASIYCKHFEFFTKVSNNKMLCVC